MNAQTVVFGAIVFGLASAALSSNDPKPAADEYRWIVVDGPYAWPQLGAKTQAGLALCGRTDNLYLGLFSSSLPELSRLIRNNGAHSL
jgi:hypothetical protein